MSEEQKQALLTTLFFLLQEVRFLTNNENTDFHWEGLDKAFNGTKYPSPQEAVKQLKEMFPNGIGNHPKDDCDVCKDL